MFLTRARTALLTRARTVILGFTRTVLLTRALTVLLPCTYAALRRSQASGQHCTRAG